jgi:hypothetical protein
VKTAFKRFSRLLDARIAGGIPTTEDSVRYTFFHATRLSPQAIILEDFHTTRKDERRRIDAILLLSERRRVALEFKYHRALRTGSSRPRPLQAGTILADMRRLHEYRGASEKYLVYVTDDEMARYLRSPRNGLAELFDAQHESFPVTPEMLKTKCRTFQKHAGVAFSADIELAHTESLHHGYEVRIWKVR